MARAHGTGCPTGIPRGDKNAPTLVWAGAFGMRVGRAAASFPRRVLRAVAGRNIVPEDFTTRQYPFVEIGESARSRCSNAPGVDVVNAELKVVRRRWRPPWRNFT